MILQFPSVLLSLLFGIILQWEAVRVRGSILGSILGGNSESAYEYTSYYRSAVCKPNSPIRYPASTDEVVILVREAIRKGTSCKAFGQRHSVTDIICTDGIPIDMSGFQDMEMNEDETVRVGAGVNVNDIGDFLLANGRALRSMPGYGNITIAGAIGTGAHGSSIRYTSSISEQMVGLVIVDGQAQVQHISEEEDLQAFRVHLGLLGIIVEVTLVTQPLYKVHSHSYVTDDALLFNGRAIDLAYDADQLAFYWFPAYSKVVVINSTFVDADTPGNAISHDIVPEMSATLSFLSNQAMEKIQVLGSTSTLNIIQAYSMRTLYTKVPDYVPIFTEDGSSVQNPAVGFPHRMLAATCKNTGWYQCPWLHMPEDQHYVDNEVAVDLEDLPYLVRTVKDILTKYPAVFPIQGIRLRFSGASNTWMSFNYGRASCHFEFFFGTRYNPYENPGLGLAAFQAMLQAMVWKYTGRPHWGKTGLYYHSKEVIERKLDPWARESFLAKMSEYDPDGIFLNDFGRRLEGSDTKISSDPRTTHCALLDNCICSHYYDCAWGQTCSTIDGYPDFPVCKDKEHLLDVLDDNPTLPSSSFSDFLIFVAGLVKEEKLKEEVPPTLSTT